MLRKLLGAGMLLATLAGCTKLEGRACTSNEQCAELGGVCDTTLGHCYREEETNDCSPACAAYEACSLGECKPRFTAVDILTPTEGAVLDGGTVQVSARLVPNPSYASTTVFPETLTFGATRTQGGDVGSFGAVTRTDATYTVAWTPPATEAQLAVSAAHPEPAVGLNDTVNVTVDAVAPDLTVVVPTAQIPADTGGFRYADPGLASAWRRDQVVEVRVESNATDLDPASLQIIVRGHNGGADVTDLTPEPCQGGPAAFCRKVNVPLSRPGLDAFNGSFTVEATARDTVGNVARSTGPIPVTRWKWAFDSGGAIKGTPAIGNNGSIYFGTAETSGKLFALNPDGTLKWDLVIGQIAGSLAVGSARSGSEEYVYVAAKPSGGGTLLYAFKGSDKSQVAQCPGTGNFGASLVEGAIAVGTTSVDPGTGVITVETAVGIVNSASARIVGIRPDVLPLDPCINVSNSGMNAIPPSIPGASLVMKGEDIFFGANPSAGARLTSYSIGSNTPRANWPVTADHVPWGLALANDRVYGGQASAANPAAGNLFSVLQVIDNTVTSVTPVYSPAGGGRVFGPSIGRDNWAYFGTETSAASEFVRLALGSPSMVQNVPSSTSIKAAPVLGRNDLLYTVATDGEVSARAADSLAQVWNVALSGVSNLDVSPTLDCNRDNVGDPVAQSPLGVLYVAAGSSVHSFIVDSPGLEPAPWPKYQHDSRNTGNPATPITNCP
ncbi:MAG: hypothetical protein JXB05_22820 [Myxococcaceae bacterium]|nr:hypothetical protein [Myxococcaceae bacterium]